MRKRTHAREISLQALYQHDLERKVNRSARRDIDDFEPFLDESTQDPEVREYARRILEGTLSSLDQIDQRIAAAAEHWKLSRIAPVDRCVLRIAVFELLESSDVPPKVAINEAIELAKKFSTEQSGAFVNGVLDRIYTDLKKAEPGRI